MPQNSPKEKLPEKEYRGKLRDASDFGENLFAITIQPEGGEDLHVGPFQFERPIGLYVGQQVVVWVSPERTEKGVFHARMRWTNPMPSVRGGKNRGSGKKNVKNQSPRKQTSPASDRRKKGDTRKRRKAMLDKILHSDVEVHHAVNDVCFALNLRPHEVPGLLDLGTEPLSRPLTLKEVKALRAAKYPPKKAATAPAPPQEEPPVNKEVANVPEEKDSSPSEAADYVAAVAALKAEFDALEALDTPPQED